jgi:glycosyltransferase involved in cell wall biosynthesis
MIVHQLVHTLSYGDAISGEVLALQRSLRALGHESEIYALNIHPFYKGKALLAAEFPTSFAGEVILHYSLGSPLNDLYRKQLSAKRTLVYHNLTPARFFEQVNPRIVSDIESGMKELPVLCRESTRVIADSTYNAQELLPYGISATVVPLPLDTQKWACESNAGIAGIVKGQGGLHLLHVGRIAPNKALEDIIKVFYFVHHYGMKNSKLWLVGIDIDTEIYSFELKRLAHELDLQDAIVFTGPLADSEVKALYENCSVYICMSEHEGFCLPVVEAMHFGMPVISSASSALPDTIGSGGILVHEKRHAEIAELVLLSREEGTLRTSLIEQGHKRAQELSLEDFERNVRNLFAA